MRNFIINKFIYIFYFIVILFICIFIFYFLNNKYSFSIINDDISIMPGTEYIPNLISNDTKYSDYSNYDWSSQDENIVTVDSLGNIKAIASGNTQVKVKSKRGFHTKYINISVLEEEIKNLSFKNYDIGLEIGDKYELEPYVNNKKVESINLNYEIENNSIVSIDNNGVITALAIGSTKIYVSTLNGIKCELLINVSEKNIEIDSLNFVNEAISMEQGKSIFLDIIINPIDATNKDVTWTSSNPNVISVNNGLVTALSEGTSKITVTTNNGKSATCVIKVVNQKILPDSVNFDSNSLSMEYNQTMYLNIQFLPVDTTERNVTWTSSNPSVVSVNNGLVTALSEGTSKITVTTSNGKKAECTVTVKKIEATSIKLNKSTMSLYIGESSTLVANISPSNTTNKNVTWTSSNPNVISVNNGLVTALSEGTSKITVTTSNGKKAECTITVKKIEATSIKLNKSTMSLCIGESSTLVANISPSNTTNKNVTWTSSNPNVVSVNNGLVTALSEGTSKITVTTSNGKKAECTVTVKKIEATSIELNKSTMSLYIGESSTLVANISPLDTTNKNVTWTSSNPSVVSVNNGLVTALSEGTSKITVTTSNGKKAECTVTVSSNTFTNPLVEAADPWVIKNGTTYYYLYTKGYSVYLSSTQKLSELAKNGKFLFSAGVSVWAPELHYINGRWYIYYASPRSGQSDRRMFVRSSDNIMGPYEYEGQITDPSDKWAIDGTVLQWNGELYFIWSGWEGDTNVRQNLYIAHMSSPTTIDSERVMISTPDYDWEKKGSPYVNEGPEVLIKNNQLYIIYSASGSWTTYYCLGMLTFTGGNIMDKNSWVKSTQPVFKSANGVYGPGHASFVKSPDGTEDWIVYHAFPNINTIDVTKRNVRIQKFNWNGNIPVFGEPIGIDVPIKKPSGE